MLCICTHSLTSANDPKIGRSRDAQAVLRNNLKWREAAEQAMKRGRNFFYFVVVNLDLLCTLVLLICDVYIRTGDGYVASKIFKLIEIKSDPTVDQGNCRLDFRRSLVSGLPSMDRAQSVSQSAVFALCPLHAFGRGARAHFPKSGW